MTIQEIKQAIAEGKTVYYQSLLYVVAVNSVTNELYIKCTSNGHMIGMEADNGEMINAKESDFFTEKP